MDDTLFPPEDYEEKPSEAKPWQGGKPMEDRVERLPMEDRFDGRTYDPDQDGERLSGQLKKVYSIMSQGGWHTLASMAEETGASEASVSARIRDLRKPKFGRYEVERKRMSGGLFVYRLCQETA
jgi:biotin operon repressor